MKNIFLAIFCLVILIACDNKQENKENTASDQEVQTSLQISIPESEKENIYSFQKNNLSNSCQSTNNIICAIEEAIKCALAPKQKYCDKQNMPDFIFYDDSMFADDNNLGRPTWQSFQFIKNKPLDDTTIEVLTKGECDKNWFGNCQGNVIYVLSNKTGKWIVKEIYAIETIK